MRYYDDGMAVRYLYLELEKETYIVSFGYEDFTHRKSQKKIHKKQDHTLQFIEFGEGFYHLDKDIFKLKANDLFYIPADRPILYYKNKQNPYKYYWIGLTGPKVEKLLAECGISEKKPVIHFDADNDILAFFKTLDPHAENTDFEIKAALFNIFNKLQIKTKANIRKKANDDNILLLKEIVQFIDMNITNNELTVDFIGSMFNLNTVTLYRSFSKYKGMSIKQYIIKKRIAIAKEFLEQGYNVTFTASSCGFSDIYYFSKSFKKHTGYSPTEYIDAFAKKKV